MHRLSYCFKAVFTADDRQLINSLRQLKVEVHKGFLKNFCRKIRCAEDLTTCFQTLTNMGLWKEFQAVGDRAVHARLATQSQSGYD